MNSKLIRYLQNHNHKLKLPDVKPKEVKHDKIEVLNPVVEELKVNEGVQKTNVKQQPQAMQPEKLNSLNFGGSLESYNLGVGKKGRRISSAYKNPKNNGTFNF